MLQSRHALYRNPFALAVKLAGLLLMVGMGTARAASANGDGTPHVFSWEGNPKALNAQEWATHREDRKYVQALAPAYTSVRLNLADPRQFRFVIARLKLVGKTPANSPEFFRRIAVQRNKDILSGYPNGEVVMQAGAGRKNEHGFSSGNYLNDIAFEAISYNTRTGIVPYISVDSAAWNPNGDLVSGMGYTEGYNHTFVRAGTLANVDGDISSNFTLDSMGYIDDGANFFSIYVQRANGGRDRPKPIIDVSAPVNTVGDACVDICLSRTWTGDCDYDLTGQLELKIPFAGSATLNQVPNSNGYFFDANKIAGYGNGTLVAPGNVKVVLTHLGGGCDASTLTLNSTAMREFWSTVQVSADLKTMTWNATGVKALLFDPSCQQVQNEVLFTAHIPVPGYQGNPSNGSTWYIDVTNDPNTQVPSAETVPCITVTNSCMAEGSKIQMADGRMVPIEDVQIGDRVANPYHPGDKALTVMDKAKGTESVPMVRIQDQAGHSLLLTEMHPMPTLNKGMVLAKRLQVGDKVMTLTGPSKLVRIERQPFGGKVYNLKVGSEAELRDLGVDQSVVYANGILTGDGQIQAKYELLEMTASTRGDALKQLPMRWHQDYKNSARR